MCVQTKEIRCIISKLMTASIAQKQMLSYTRRGLVFCKLLGRTILNHCVIFNFQMVLKSLLSRLSEGTALKLSMGARAEMDMLFLQYPVLMEKTNCSMTRPLRLLPRRSSCTCVQEQDVRVILRSGLRTLSLSMFLMSTLKLVEGTMT